MHVKMQMNGVCCVTNTEELKKKWYKVKKNFKELLNK